MTISRERPSIPWLALSVSALSWGLSGMPSALQTRSALGPAAIAPGELWRLWSGHLVHFNGAHLRGDLLAFLLWAALLERQSRRALAQLLLVGAPLLSLAILLCYPTLEQYRGLSGLDCSLVVVLIWQRGVASARWRGVGLLSLACFVSKCVYELAAGRAILAPDLGAGVKLLPLAHVLGAVLGVAVAFVVGRSGSGSGSGSGKEAQTKLKVIAMRLAASVGYELAW